jgi:hypothetical protein
MLPVKVFFLMSVLTLKKGSPVHVAPACAGSGEGSDHFGCYVTYKIIFMYTIGCAWCILFLIILIQ